MLAAGPRTGRTPRRVIRLTVAIALLVSSSACTADEPPGASSDRAEDVLDLAAPPTPDAILDPDRGDPPATLQTEDLVVGSGAVVATGDALLVEHLGLRWSDGGEFTTSWLSDEPMRFELGAGTVIPGWEQGILGDEQAVDPLRVGGRRVLTIPPELAYGERGSGSSIGPGETLVFIIDLIDTNDSLDTAPDGAVQGADPEDFDG
jgi:peptidylprolyl isomerase